MRTLSTTVTIPRARAWNIVTAQSAFRCFLLDGSGILTGWPV